VPGIWHENYWFARHEAAYRWLTGVPTARRCLTGGRVLDAGCGEGYGAALLGTSGAAQVVGLDYDFGAVRHATRRYDGLTGVQGNLVRTGFADGSFDVVVSLQTVEHLWDQQQFVAECRRILAPAGTVVLSTPNRLTFPDGNWYHTRELTAGELVALVEPELEVVELLGLWHGARIGEWEAGYGSCVTAQLAGDPQTWSAELTGLVRSVDYRDFELSGRRTDLDDSLDLLMVARHR
jgi:SAM-dependent methyltransferase